MKLSGETRSENTGSVMTFRPPSCASIVAWPTHVMAGAIAAPARAFDSMKPRSGATCGVALIGGRGRPASAASIFHFSSVVSPFGSNSR